MPGLFAALDLGSNTFRLILARLQAPGGGGGMDPASKRVWQEIPRISEGLQEGGAFREAPLARAWKALEGFDAVVKAENPSRTLACATMAARAASDGRDFMEAVRERFGWECGILRGDEEARLSAAGALAGFPGTAGDSVIFDIGGRSTEFAVAGGRSVVAVKSLPVGVVGLKEAFLFSDPPSEAELRALEARVSEALVGAPLPERPEGAGLIGTAGTVTTAAAMLLGLEPYSPEKVHGAAISRKAAEKLYRELSAEPQAERARRPGLHPMRADVITGGLALVLGILDRYGAGEFTASDWGLLEGLWLASAGVIPLKP
jgi:exopolyphosphatase/guanosine-5'-triphosphate,3'-diphosphate pyrophosphatase